MTYRAIVSPAPAPMPMWVITASQSDFPGKHVVRRHEIRANGQPSATAEHYVCGTIEEARGFVPSGLVRFQRDPADDPVAVEVWL